MAEVENQRVQQVKQINDNSWEDVELRSVDSNEVFFFNVIQRLRTNNHKSMRINYLLKLKLKTKFYISKKGCEKLCNFSEQSGVFFGFMCLKLVF